MAAAAHYLNTALTSGSDPSWHRIGKDLEEYNVELSADVKTTKNILGEANTKVSSYEVSGSVEPYYANQGDGLFEFLQDIIDNRKVLDEVVTDAVEVHLWETGAADGTFVAFKESCAIEVTSYGGDSTGYQIPFKIHYNGDRIKGTFNPSTKTFTADSAGGAA